MFQGSGIRGAVTRVDMHLHSAASGEAGNWWVKKLGAEVEARESYTPPEDAYRMVKRAGMDFAVLTDHETINGTKSLAHHPDMIVGVEVNARFPEDGETVDILLYGVDDEVHREAQARRPDVYSLVDYLRGAGVLHVLAHPLYAMPGPLDRKAIEKRIALFGLWEFINGSRPASQNRLAREIAEAADASEIRRISSGLGLPVPPHTRINGTGGSDDHGCVYGGRTFTEVPQVRSAKEFLEAVAAGESRAFGEDGSVEKVARTALGIAGSAFSEGRDTGGIFQKMFPVAGVGRIPGAVRLGGMLGGGDRGDDSMMSRLPLLGKLDEERAKQTLSGMYESKIAGAFAGSGSGLPALDFLGSIGGFINAHAFISPYVAVHGYFGRETGKARKLRSELLPESSEELRVGLFVDGMDSVHGVATMYRNLQEISGEIDTGVVDLVRCGSGQRDGMYTVPALATLPVPMYDGLDLGIPSLLGVLDHISLRDYNLIHVAAPGPLGLAALISGLILGIPVVGAYHTEFGAYARALSGDALVSEVVEVAVREFYERCSAVVVPSSATELSLKNRGYGIRRFEVLKNGVDNSLFSPSRRSEAIRRSLGKDNEKLLLYVGRVSREKGLDLLAEGYMQLRKEREDVRLVVVGDGTYREELQRELGDTATFTGFLSGETLAKNIASCDIFVFPSTTDTLGRAVIEAQASGLPAVVCRVGGPSECIIPEVTGLVAEPLDERSEVQDFFQKTTLFLDDDEARKHMGARAVEFAGTLQWDAVLEDLVSIHRKIVGSVESREKTEVRAAGVK